MRKVGGNTGGVDDIVEGKLVNEGRELKEEGQRLRKRDLVSPCAALTCAQRRGSGVTLPVQYRQRRQQQLKKQLEMTGREMLSRMKRTSLDHLECVRLFRSGDARGGGGGVLKGSRGLAG